LPVCEKGRGLIAGTIAAVNALDISPAAREQIFSGNARALLKLA
jgi:predicted TIM-barrel fold metal-dependent hydrolase